MIVVCGDSFNFDDPEYPDIHWTSNIPNLTNLSIPGASNLAIRLQIDRAISLNPKLIIVSFTSCMRTVVKYKNKAMSNKLLDRLYSPGKEIDTSDLISFPYAGVALYNKLSSNQEQIIKQYVSEFVDLDLIRQENFYLIKDALETLLQSGIKFSYSLGGFDHKSFCNESPYSFAKFKNFETPINLWNHCNTQKDFRPWFHVLDKQIHIKLANYYKCLMTS